MSRLAAIAFTALLTPLIASADWFEDFKADATDAELHQFLYEMPKGGDLHLHLSGSGFPEWWLELALESRARGYTYFTKTKINNCRPHGEAGFGHYLIHYQTIADWRWAQLSDCEQSEYVPLADLKGQDLENWLSAIKLDRAHEGRNELFSYHWQRLGDMLADPYILAGLLLKNLQAFSDEGLRYIEPQLTPFGYRAADGSPIAPNEFAEIIRQHLETPAFKRTGVKVQFQVDLLRFLPSTEAQIEAAYEFVSTNDPWVAVNMVGREDDDKGYPARFLETYRALRTRYNNVRLSIHAGEVDEPNSHVRDTILLGADRIGHGLNLITDDETMRQMRYGRILVEINLISNYLLEYVSDYSEHPFPEYLRVGIPVALSTDDRGMWDSNMTDEFFVAVKEYNLSWAEIRRLSENSLEYAFVDDATRAELLSDYRAAADRFEQRMRKKGAAGLKGQSGEKLGFVCRKYNLCSKESGPD